MRLLTLARATRLIAAMLLAPAMIAGVGPERLFSRANSQVVETGPKGPDGYTQRLVQIPDLPTVSFNAPPNFENERRARQATRVPPAEGPVQGSGPAPRCPVGTDGPAPTAPRDKLPTEIGAGINIIRGEPVNYVPVLESFRGKYNGNILVTPSQPNGIVTREGVGALADAVAWVGMQPPRKPLTYSNTLAAVAQALVTEQGPLGTTGHLFADGTRLGDRAKRLCADMFISESITYGPSAAEDVFLQLIIDDGVPGRGHRKMLFSPEYNYIGIACGPHAKYGEMCVIDYSATIDGGPVLPRCYTGPNDPGKVDPLSIRHSQFEGGGTGLKDFSAQAGSSVSDDNTAISSCP